MSSDTFTGEKPLSGIAKVMLVLGVGVVMLSFYVFSIFAVLLLSALIAAELLLLLALARFAAARIMAPFLGKHMGLLTLFVRNFRLRKGVDFKIPLRQADAPSLYEMLVQLCRRLELTFPQEIVLQMGDGAWVRLKGMRSGSGKVTLGVGYDLLAGLAVAEMEAVLAHEMTHAKLISRGYKNWLGAGQVRIRSLAVALWADINAARRAKQSSSVAKFLFVMIDRLVRISTRLVAAYSRQDEFEADRGAAELCGSGVMKSALSKLESLHRITSSLPWNERVAHLQQSSGYSQWLLQEIAQGTAVPPADPSQTLFDKYSTHPLIRDRLAALPSDDKVPAANSHSGIQLLAHPDAIAVRLVSELQRLMAEQEKKDSKALERLSRKTGQNAHLRPWQVLGVLLILAGFACGLIGLILKEVAVMVELTCLAAIVIGIFAIRLGVYRDRFELPVPDYKKLVHPPKDKPGAEEIQKTQKEIEADLTQRFSKERMPKKAVLLAKESYAALETCDYLRAHIASRECLKFDKKSVEGALALAVACAAFGQNPTVINLLAFIRQRTGFTTFSTSWGTAWAALLVGDWIRAEAMLVKALKLQPQQTALVAFLAIAQSRRGKLQSAIMNARLACDADPRSKEKLKFLIARLLDGGFTREAQERFKYVDTESDSDPELMLSLTQLNLLQRDFSEAQRWTKRIKELDASPQTLVRLGKLYETARHKDQATLLYQQALATGHYPEAHLGLGRLETERNNKAEAQRHILAALNVDQPLGIEGVGTLQLLHPILTQMLWLQEPVSDCRAWITTFPRNGQPAALAGQSFVVYAQDLQRAQEHFQTMLGALQPGKPPLIPPAANWSPAPRPMQPAGLVRPGVQGIWN